MRAFPASRAPWRAPSILPGWDHHLIAVDACRRGDHPAMLSAARNAAVDGSGISWPLLAIAQGAAGDKEGARPRW